MSADGRRELPDTAKTLNYILFVLRSFHIITFAKGSKPRQTLSSNCSDCLTISPKLRSGRGEASKPHFLLASLRSRQAGRARTDGTREPGKFVMSHTTSQFPFRQPLANDAEGRRAKSLEPGARAGPRSGLRRGPRTHPGSGPAPGERTASTITDKHLGTRPLRTSLPAYLPSNLPTYLSTLPPLSFHLSISVLSPSPSPSSLLPSLPSSLFILPPSLPQRPLSLATIQDTKRKAEAREEEGSERAISRRLQHSSERNHDWAL